MDDQPATLGIQLAVAPDDDTEEVAEATLRLRRGLLDLDVEAVEVPPAGEAPPGTRAVELAALGALVVTIGKSQLLAPWWPRSARGWPAPRSAASSWSWTATPWS